MTCLEQSDPDRRVKAQADREQLHLTQSYLRSIRKRLLKIAFTSPPRKINRSGLIRVGLARTEREQRERLSDQPGEVPQVTVTTEPEDGTHLSHDPKLTVHHFSLGPK